MFMYLCGFIHANSDVCMCIYLCGFVHANSGACRSQKRVTDTLKLELQPIVESPDVDTKIKLVP